MGLSSGVLIQEMENSQSLPFGRPVRMLVDISFVVFSVGYQ